MRRAPGSVRSAKCAMIGRISKELILRTRKRPGRWIPCPCSSGPLMAKHRKEFKSSIAWWPMVRKWGPQPRPRIVQMPERAKSLWASCKLHRSRACSVGETSSNRIPMWRRAATRMLNLQLTLRRWRAAKARMSTAIRLSFSLAPTSPRE